MVLRTRDISCDKCNEPITFIINNWWGCYIWLCKKHAEEFKKLSREEKNAYFKEVLG